MALHASVAFAADQAEAEKQLKDRAAEFQSTWNKHDAKALAAFWAEDGDLIDPAGVASKGRAAVEQYFTENFAGPMKDSTNEITVTGVHMAADDLAVVDWDAALSGMHMGPPSDRPASNAAGADEAKPAPFKHHVVLVMKRQGDEWMILAARPYAVMPKPGE
jgi:uncharacterized protein (TIGR02246 family)